MKVRFYIVSLLLLFVSLTNAQIKNTVTFVADMTVLIDNGFDPADHQLTIEGLNWDNGEVSVVGDRQLTLDPQNPSQYKTQLVLTSAAGMVVGDTARWKFKGSPNEAFYDGGWEAGD
ncbi:MAG: hypothetical protein K9I99_13910, partial [Melioribacteraceae bacterium]|nr:hypothetical protein [Melioribacteraceae bacterium]